MTNEQIRQYAFKIFDKLIIGQSIKISDFAKKDPSSFIQYGKDYIDQGGGLLFSKDYTFVTKVQSFQELMNSINHKTEAA